MLQSWVKGPLASDFSADQECTLDSPRTVVRPDNLAQKKVETPCGEESLG